MSAGDRVPDINPQREQMADESMVRTLAAQAQAIWPQEEPLFARYGLHGELRILDAGCGTGEISSRLAGLYPRARILGVDVLEEPLAIARSRYEALASRLSFAQESVYELPAPDAAYDLTVCRHVLQAIPQAERVLAELRRVTKPGGWLHLIVEDYGMLHFPRGDAALDAFLREAPAQFGAANGTDMFVGRHTWAHLKPLGLTQISVDYVVVDTVRVPRDIMAAIFVAWRDGYVRPIGERTRFTSEQARAAFDRMIAVLRDPQQYAAWIVPVVAARVPTAS
jgi:SAM-dependent methyltransferase